MQKHVNFKFILASPRREALLTAPKDIRNRSTYSLITPNKTPYMHRYSPQENELVIRGIRARINFFSLTNKPTLDAGS